MEFAKRWLPAMLLAVVSVSLPAAEPLHGLPSTPVLDQVPVPYVAAAMGMANGDYEWLGSRMLNPNEPESCRRQRIVFTRWRPATAGTLEWPLPLLGTVQAQTHLPAGILFVALYGDGNCSPDRRTEIGLYTGQGSPVLLKLDHRIPDADLRVQTLSDSSVALIAQDPATHGIVVHVVRYGQGNLQVDRMPDVGIVKREGFALATLDENHLMLLGGSEQQPDGKLSLHAETYVLDVKAKAWHPGPWMHEGRTRAAATRLPDGSVLVAGGFTDQGNPSRTTEQWSSSTNAFAPAALMATANAYQQAVWLPLDGKPTLLMTGGDNAGAQALDAATGTWRVVATWPRVADHGSCSFFPFAVDGRFYVWNMEGAANFGNARDNCAGYKNSTLVPLMLRIESSAGAAPASDVVLSYQSEAAFLPATKDRSALMVGGTVAGTDYSSTWRITAGVAAIDINGHMFSMPSLVEPRRKAQVFRMDGGVIVVGGTNVDERDEQQAKPLPAEWMDLSNPLHPGAWQKVGGDGVALGSSIGQLANGHLLELDAGGNVNEIELSHDGASLSLKRTPWPAMNLIRLSSLYAPVRVRQLADGRVIVAGGEVRDKIALLKSDSEQPDAPDEYIPFGGSHSSAEYEIFDPATRRWIRSATSDFAGDMTAIGEDGQVWKFGQSGTSETVDRKRDIEVSSIDGLTWTPLSTEAYPDLDWSQPFKVFTLDGEIFVCGQHIEADKSQVSTMLWLNPKSNKWEPLQTAAGDAWHATAGEYLVAHLLTGKTIIVPGEGL